MGVSAGISRSEVSRICAGLDERVAAFRNQRRTENRLNTGLKRLTGSGSTRTPDPDHAARTRSNRTSQAPSECATSGAEEEGTMAFWKSMGAVTVSGILLSACGTDESDSGTTTASTLSAGPSTTADRESVVEAPVSRPKDTEAGGISFDEAEREGVLTGDFDALVQPTGITAKGTYGFELRNVGRLADTYRIAVEAEAGSEASVSPDGAALKPGEAAIVEVTVESGDGSAVDLVIHSTGLGDEVVRVPSNRQG
jgi:hypothetical protein